MTIGKTLWGQQLLVILPTQLATIQFLMGQSYEISFV